MRVFLSAVKYLEIDIKQNYLEALYFDSTQKSKILILHACVSDFQMYEKWTFCLIFCKL